MITAVVVEVAGGRPGVARSGSVRSAAAANGGLVGHHRTHIRTEGLHVLCDEDSVLLGLIPESVEELSE